MPHVELDRPGIIPLISEVKPRCMPEYMRMHWKRQLGELPTIEMIEDRASGKKHWKNRALGDLLTKSDKNDVIVVSEISRLGRSTLHVLEILELAVRKRICIHTIKNQMIMDGSMQSTISATVLGLATQIEREFISVRTKGGFSKKKA